MASSLAREDVTCIIGKKLAFLEEDTEALHNRKKDIYRKIKRGEKGSFDSYLSSISEQMRSNKDMKEFLLGMSYKLDIIREVEQEQQKYHKCHM